MCPGVLERLPFPLPAYIPRPSSPSSLSMRASALVVGPTTSQGLLRILKLQWFSFPPLRLSLRRLRMLPQIVLATDLAHGFEYVSRFSASTNTKGNRKASIVPDMAREGSTGGGTSRGAGGAGSSLSAGKDLTGKDPLQAQILLMQMVMKVSTENTVWPSRVLGLLSINILPGSSLAHADPTTPPPHLLLILWLP